MNMSLIWEVQNANNCFLLSSIKSGFVKLRLNLPKLIIFLCMVLKSPFYCSHKIMFLQFKALLISLMSCAFRPAQNMMAATPTPVTNPFGTLPAMPQMMIGRSAGSGPSLQYGISSMPVSWEQSYIEELKIVSSMRRGESN